MIPKFGLLTDPPCENFRVLLFKEEIFMISEFSEFSPRAASFGRKPGCVKLGEWINFPFGASKKRIFAFSLGVCAAGYPASRDKMQLYPKKT